MKRYLWTAVLTLAVSGCGETATDAEGLPDWLRDKIAEMEAQPVANPPAYVARWEYASSIYYYIPPRCCDVFSELYHPEGTLVCHPDGGLTGQGDGRCPALGDRLSEDIVWRDRRS